MLRIKIKGNKIIVKHDEFKVLREDKIEITYKAGRVLLSPSSCSQEKIYLMDVCYCKEKDKIKLYIKTSCNEYEEIFAKNESKIIEGLTIELLGFNKDYVCF